METLFDNKKKSISTPIFVKFDRESISSFVTINHPELSAKS